MLYSARQYPLDAEALITIAWRFEMKQQKSNRLSNRQLTKRGFSNRAEEALNQKVQQFRVKLVRDAAELAKRDRSDVVSVGHVEQASDQLVPRKNSRLYRHVGYVAGIVVGAGLSATFGFATAEGVPLYMYLITIALCMAGSFAIALHIAHD